MEGYNGGWVRMATVLSGLGSHTKSLQCGVAGEEEVQTLMAPWWPLNREGKVDKCSIPILLAWAGLSEGWLHVVLCASPYLQHYCYCAITTFRNCTIAVQRKGRGWHARLDFKDFPQNYKSKQYKLSNSIHNPNQILYFGPVSHFVCGDWNVAQYMVKAHLKQAHLSNKDPTHRVQPTADYKVQSALMHCTAAHSTQIGPHWSPWSPVCSHC